MNGNRRPLSHVLYTNATGPDGSAGFRIVSVGFSGSEEDKASIGKWLKTLQPAPGPESAWAVQSFYIGGKIWAALAVVDSHFELDDHGRGGGLLAHAFLVPVPEGEPPGDFGSALGEVAGRSFALSASAENGRLLQHWEGCKINADIEVPPLDVTSLRMLKGQFLQQFFNAASLAERGDVKFSGMAEGDLPLALLRAGGALPPPLRLAVVWGTGLAAPPAGGFLASPARGAPAPPAGECGAMLENWISTAAPAEIQRLAGDWTINAWDRLPAGMAHQPAEEPAVVREEALELRKDREATKSAGRGPATKNSEPVQLDEQYQALQKWLKSYVDQKLGEAPVADISGGISPTLGARFAAWLMSAAPLLAAVAAILALLLLFWNLHLTFEVRQLETALAKPPAPATSNNPAGQPAGGGNDEPSGADLTPAQPAEEWRAFLSQDRKAAGKWFAAVAAARDLEPQQIGSTAKQKFKEWAKLLEADQDLPAGALLPSATGVFEYAHARWAKAHGLGRPQDDWVTFDAGEAARNLPALISDLGLTTELGDDAKVDEARVQVAVAEAWLQRQGSS